jgi:hypothetical protein
MEIEAFASHFEEHATVNAPADLLFDHLAGRVYARWCVRNVLQQVLAHFGTGQVGLPADLRHPSGKAA